MPRSLADETIIAGVDGNTCPPVPENFCATLYEGGDCGGWALNIGRGYTELPHAKKNEAESVVLRAGCRLIGALLKTNSISGARARAFVVLRVNPPSSGYDKPIGWPGARTTTFDAADGLVLKLKDNQLGNGIDAVSCYC